MKVEGVANRPFYTKAMAKRELRAAATSAAFSAGLTLVLNRGKGVKKACQLGGIVAGVSLLIGLAQRAFSYIREVKEAKDTEKQVPVENAKMVCHQG